MISDNLKVSIITVSYNSADTIEQTIQSVLNQTYKNIEYIIIDGQSTDGTVNVVRKYERFIDCFVSESDNGIYDAMNKGITHATGDIIVPCNLLYGIADIHHVVKPGHTDACGLKSSSVAHESAPFPGILL